MSSALTSLVNTMTSLKSLSIASGFGKIVIPFLDGIKNNKNLLYLNISSNKIGDTGASVLATYMRCNNTLLHIEVDDNHIGLAGWHLILAVLQERKNVTLQEMSLPWGDYDGAIKTLNPARREWLRQILIEIQHHLLSNRAGHPHPEAENYRKKVIHTHTSRRGPVTLYPLIKVFS